MDSFYKFLFCAIKWHSADLHLLSKGEKDMKQCYTIGNYVKISQLDDEGNTSIILAEAEIPLKVMVGKELQVRPCERYAELISLGVVREVRNYKKRSHIEVRTGKCWYAIEADAGLESIMTDSMNYCDM